MNNLPEVDRSAVVRRNGLWRHASETLSHIGAFAIVALVALPLNGVALDSLAIAALSLTAAVSVALSFLCLRFIGHSV